MIESFKEFLIKEKPEIATAIDYYLLNSIEGQENTGTEADKYVKKLNSDGYVVIENYLSPKICDQLCEKVDEIFEENSDLVQKRGDLRLFGIECLSDKIKDFNTDPLLEQIACQYYQKESYAIFTLGGKLIHSVGEIKSSGGGWHRDSFFRQFKAMVYLTDVSEENGPFQIIKNSEKPEQIIEDMKIAGLRYGQNRIEDEQVQKIIEANPERLITFAMSKGTLILFDSTTIHRGSPIQSGRRYSLTNYYYEKDKITEFMFKHFSPNMYYINGFTKYWEQHKVNNSEKKLANLFNEGKYEEIVKVGWSENDNIEQNFYKGKAYKNLGNINEAIKVFNQYLLKIDNIENSEKFPAVTTTVHISSVYFHLGECYLINKMYDEAEECLLQSLKFSGFQNERCKQLLKEVVEMKKAQK